MDMVSVMWFRRDLRLEDNIALAKAFKESEKLLLLFHVNPEQFLEKGSLNQAAFFQSVAHFKAELKKEDLYLHILFGEIEDCFSALKNKLSDWSDVYFNLDEKGFGRARDQKMVRFFNENMVKIHTSTDHHLHGSTEIKNQSDDFYKVFTPYFNQWIERKKPKPVEVEIEKEKVVTTSLFQDQEEKFEAFVKENDLNLEHTSGTAAAKNRLEEFISEDLEDYDRARDVPEKDQTSHLSPYLRTGELSIRTVFSLLADAPDSRSKDTFIKELAWRDFYNMIYATNQNQKEQPIKEEFSTIEWENDTKKFENWKEGKTGFPIIDAGMRQLKEKGWMHNRLRMIVASFLTKDLLIDWRWGEKYFQEMLIDYDPASNIGGWQWAASTGTDAVPYFRIFNPTTQSKKNDPSGEFIRQYVTELEQVKEKYIHEPQKMSKEEQTEIGLIIGEDYPFPIVNHSEARKRAIKVYEESKEIAQEIDR